MVIVRLLVAAVLIAACGFVSGEKNKKPKVFEELKDEHVHQVLLDVIDTPPTPVPDPEGTSEDLGTFQDESCCDCSTLDEIREVVKEELSAFKTNYAISSSSYYSSGGSSGMQAGGSNGGSTGSVFQWNQPFNGTVEYRGTVTQSSPPVVNPRRLGDAFGRRKVTIHKFASGECGVCDAWIAREAPKLQAAGVVVTQISDITSGSAPVIDACVGRNVCKRFQGYTSAEDILAQLKAR